MVIWYSLAISSCHSTRTYLVLGVLMPHSMGLRGYVLVACVSPIYCYLVIHAVYRSRSCTTSRSWVSKYEIVGIYDILPLLAGVRPIGYLVCVCCESSP